MAIEFVGTASAIGTTSTLTVSLTALTGGISSSVAAGDLILVLSGWASTTNQDPGVQTAGYTELADLYSNNDHDINMSVAYSIAGATPPTSVVTSASGAAGNGSAAIVVVFRGVDPNSPFSATITTSTGTGSTNIDAPAITPSTSGSWILAMGMVGGINGQTFTPPSGFTEIADRNSGSTRTREASGTVAYLANPTAGVSVNPAAFTGSGSGALAAWAGATVSLRAAAGRVKVWNGSAWAIKPVKYWNGSSWVIKPVKRWNGSAWVTTNY